MRLGGALKYGAVLVFSIVFVSPRPAPAKSNQPYIDEIKSQLEPEEKRPSVIESVQKEVPPSPRASYIDELKSDWDTEEEAAQKKQSLIEREKARMREESKGEKQSGAIERVRNGTSELELKRPGEIGNAMGFRVGASLTRDITARNGAGDKNYSDIYGKDRVPEINLYYEFQSFHSEWLGSLGLFGSMGLGFDSGQGSFAYTPPNVAPGGAPFTAQSRTRFYFWYFPTTVGLNYRFNLFRVVRPFVMAGPSLIPYWETRNDSKSGIRGYSRGLFISAGASILLDFFSRESAWELYDAHEVKHFYLTIDYSRLTPMGGDVRFDIKGLSAGLTFEI